MVTGRALSYGEVSPALHKRVDLESYARSAKLLTNWKVMPEGGVETRPGLQLVAPTKYMPAAHSTIIREFVFTSSDGNTYAIEFGHLYARFHQNGVQIRRTGQNITGITNAVTGVLSYSGADPSNGDCFYISGVRGMEEINGQWVYVSNVNAGANTFEMQDYKNILAALVTSLYGTYTSGGTIEKVYEITTPFSDVDLPGLSFTQLNDAVVICGGVENRYYPQVLLRSSDTSWAIGDLNLRNYDSMVYGIAGAAGAAGGKTFKYKVTYIPIGSTKESLPGCEAAKSVTGITKANPAVVTCAAHGYNTGDHVVFQGVGGMNEINGREFEVEVASAYADEAPITITAISLASPMVVTKNGHGLSNGDKVHFSVTGMTELNEITYGTVVAAAANTFQVYYYGTTTKVDSTGYQAFTAGTVTRNSPNPTSTNSFTLRNVDSSNYGAFAASGSDAVAKTHAVIYNAADPTTTAPNVITWTGIVSNNFGTLVTYGAKQYVIYRETNGVWGYVGVTSGTQHTFSDVGITPDTSDRPFEYADLWQSEDDYPYCTAFARQRLLFGGSNNNPNRVIGSVISDYYNFSVHTPGEASDATTIDLVKAQVVRSIRELAGRAIAFCSGGEFGIGDENGVIDASAPDAKQFSANGSMSLPALNVNNVATYVQARGSQVRDLGYTFEENGYRGEERSVRAKHLFKNHTIIDWCYQQVPDSVIHAVRDDGILLCCTYVREQQQVSWFKYSVNPVQDPALGWTIESVCAVPEDTQDSVYMIVNRGTVSTVERLSSRVIVNPNVDHAVPDPDLSTSVSDVYMFSEGGVQDFIPVDCARTYDGRYTGNSIYMKFGSGQAPYDETHTLTLGTTDAFGIGTPSYFNADDVGKAIFMYGATDGAMCKFTIEGYTNAHTVTGHLDRTAPSSIVSGAFPGSTVIWSKAINKMYGLNNLYNLSIKPAVFGDGFVEQSPLNPLYGTTTAVNSRYSLTFSQHYERVSVGFPFMCSLELLDIDSVQAQGGGLLSQSKVINKLYVAVDESRGLYVGSDAPDDDTEDPIDKLRPLMKRRASDLTYDDPVPLETDTKPQDCNVGWDTHGRVFIRQLDPLPARILAVYPEGKTVI